VIGTFDAGVHWSRYVTPQRGGLAPSRACVTPSLFKGPADDYGAAVPGPVLSTRNGGATWTRQKLPAPALGRQSMSSS
jgi:photosystem II stability/assembly factor-like uncharacterized protein